MRFSPTLILKRLIIERNGSPAYDEAFHQGVNIIRGENSSGKSTILNFIFYVLGGDLYDWSETAKLCTRAIAEVELNGMTATLSRDISTERGQPMDIFGGPYDAAKAAPRDEWVRYPYVRSPSKESFSQAIFRLLEIPEVASEVSGNITMHQVLRLLYADQLSPLENLFKLDPVYDSPLIRDAIGRLLCGAYDSTLYMNELKIRSLQRDFDAANAELRSLFALMGKSEEGMTVSWIDGQRRVLNEERRSIDEQTATAERELFAKAEHDQLTLRSQEEAYKAVQEAQSALSNAIQERDRLTLDIADSDAFMSTLKQKMDALQDSSIVAANLGDVGFQSCPACYAPVASAPTGADSCPLCKTPFDAGRSQSRIVALINDIGIQLRQSERLQSQREEQLAALTARIRTLQEEWERASRRLGELQRLPSTDAQEKLRALHRKAGYLERQLENLEERARLAELIGAVSTRKDDLNDQINRLRTMNDALKAQQETRLWQAYTAIADEVRTLLRSDLRRQDTFENPKTIEFDFAKNYISVDGQTYFSASSRVVLKSSFFLAFIIAATKYPTFRHPRFCMIDTTEDKGMEVIRSHNFQLLIARASEQSPVEHQIIYATSMIAPELEDERYTVGKFSTTDDPTLAIART